MQAAAASKQASNDHAAEEEEGVDDDALLLQVLQTPLSLPPPPHIQDARHAFSRLTQEEFEAEVQLERTKRGRRDTADCVPHYKDNSNKKPATPASTPTAAPEGDYLAATTTTATAEDADGSKKRQAAAVLFFLLDGWPGQNGTREYVPSAHAQTNTTYKAPHDSNMVSVYILCMVLVHAAPSSSGRLSRCFGCESND
jgi:hypothetical protein